MNSNLFELDASIRAEADEILWDKGLHALLSEYGRVQVTGSYALQVMAWRDLDIYLVRPGLSIDVFFDLGRRIAQLLEPVRMHFRNERIAKTPNLPDSGLYWGIYWGSQRSETWKLDIWGISPQENERLMAYVGAISRQLTQDARVKILNIKAQCWMLPGYRSRFSSRDIYDAVLDHDVKDLDGFEAYLRETKGYSIAQQEQK